jgi:hypothetical protein
MAISNAGELIMKQTKAGVVQIILVSSLCGSTVYAQNAVDLGKMEYESSCASRHGTAAKGDGALQKYLVKAPSDLTTLTKRNGGVFPSQRVWATVDGRTDTEIGPHGAREMPVWGQLYRTDNTPPSEHSTSKRIGALVEYLSRLQER